MESASPQGFLGPLKPFQVTTHGPWALFLAPRIEVPRGGAMLSAPWTVSHAAAAAALSLFTLWAAPLPTSASSPGEVPTTTSREFIYPFTRIY